MRLEPPGGRLFSAGATFTAGALLASMAAGLLAPSARGQEGCAQGAQLVVGSVTVHPGEKAEVPISGKVDCEITGFSLAVGHDKSRLTYLQGKPSPLIASHAGEDLVFSSLNQNSDGYAALFALFDISYPITVPPLALPAETVLAMMTYRVSSGAPEGTTPLLNRHLYYGAPNYISNIFSRGTTEDPVVPTLIDGAVEVLPNPSGTFLRGDANNDHGIDISDPIFVLIHLFLGSPGACPDASDVNDDGLINIVDIVYLLEFMFRDGLLPEPPFPNPGPDVRTDDLGKCTTS